MLRMRDLIPWGSDKTPTGGLPDDRYPLENLHRHIDRFFDDMWRGFDHTPFGISPFKVDVTEDDKAYTLSAELPGMDEKDVEIILKDGRLTIKGEKKAEKEDTKDGYSYRERTYGSFQRSFSVGDEVVADDITADFKKGVLTVTLPKSARAVENAKRIPIGTTKH